jgi:hypothetical protein
MRRFNPIEQAVPETVNFLGTRYIARYQISYSAHEQCARRAVREAGIPSQGCP